MLPTVIIVLIVILDQLSKYFATLYLEGGAAYTVIHGFLSFRYNENRGAAWGILADQRWVFMTVSTAAILAIVGYLFYTRKEKKNPLFLLSLCFFCGGGIGNMIDRVYLGYVVDFLRFDFIEFPIFNVADSFITVGAALMFLYIFYDLYREYKKSRKEKSVSAPRAEAPKAGGSVELGEKKSHE
ncbi:MAG: signal peptidase II [Clostridia bacterium]|nr:signal peptidase II [Clostridia bacterium]